MNLKGLILILLIGWYSHSIAEHEPVIAVAANFYSTLELISSRYTALTGEPLRLVSGASGTLALQIERGAPFELFLSADESYVKHLHEQGLTIDEGRIYACGRLVMFVSQSIDTADVTDVDLFLKQLDISGIKRIALANPELAPYGKAAKMVLEKYQLWGDNGPYEFIQAENVGQTAQFILTGTVDMAFLPLSLSIHPRIRELGNIIIIPANWHQPIHQRMVLMNGAGETASGFYKYLSDETALQLIRQQGYEAPE
jgi:molybdate transport system substrate-binding protein